MSEDPRARARDRVLFQLKTKGEQSAAELARRLKITPMAVRQHLAELSEEGLVGFELERRRVGRPARIWRLTDDARQRFPDSHADLTVDLIAAIRRSFGEEGVAKLLRARTRAQLRDYRARIPRAAPLARRVAALARVRRGEGYMAEWSRESDGSFLLVENHCPICAAASVCQGLCSEELGLFRRALGPGVAVERVEHALLGARRCAYRIRSP